MEKLKIDLPIIVEGKYDKIKVSSICDAPVIQTDGFGVFKSSERLALIKQLAKKSRIIVLTDSDGAGKLIRSHITSAIPKDRLIQLYVPQIEGKERRKTHASAEGYLGVEGVDADAIRRLLSPFAADRGDEVEREPIEKIDLYEAKLTGADDSAARRDVLAQRLGLPRSMTPNAFLSALNVLMDKQEFYQTVEKI